jgi:hypothetical protein
MEKYLLAVAASGAGKSCRRWRVNSQSVECWRSQWATRGFAAPRARKREASDMHSQFAVSARWASRVRSVQRLPHRPAASQERLQAPQGWFALCFCCGASARDRDRDHDLRDRSHTSCRRAKTRSWLFCARRTKRADSTRCRTARTSTIPSGEPKPRPASAASSISQCVFAIVCLTASLLGSARLSAWVFACRFVQRRCG